MLTKPQDLVPLPTSPWEERPIALPLDVEEVRTAIWRADGNITEAARVLKVPSLRLRKFVRDSPYLQEEIRECQNNMNDLAEANVLDALQDGDDKGRRDAMSKFVLLNLGKDRGYGNNSGVGKASVNIGNLTISWADGSSFGDQDDGKTIEGDIIDD